MGHEQMSHYNSSYLTCIIAFVSWSLSRWCWRASCFIFCFFSSRRGRRLQLASSNKRSSLSSSQFDNGYVSAACNYCALYNLADERSCMENKDNIQQDCMSEFLTAMERVVSNINSISRPDGFKRPLGH